MSYLYEHYIYCHFCHNERVAIVTCHPFRFAFTPLLDAQHSGAELLYRLPQQ